MVAIAARISSGLEISHLTALKCVQNAVLVWFDSHVCDSFGVGWWGFFCFFFSPPAGLLRRSDVLFAVTSGMSRWRELHHKMEESR